MTPDMFNDYDLIKDRLLKSLGDTPQNAEKRWWQLSRQHEETYTAFYKHINSTNMQRLANLETKDEILAFTSLSLFMSHLPHDCFNFVAARNPSSGSEAAEIAAKFAKDQARLQHKRFPCDGSQYSSHGSKGSIETNSQG